MLLLEFIRDVYVPSRLGLSADRVRHLKLTIGQLERYAGRPVELNDLNVNFVRGYLATLWDGHAATTVNTRRSQLVAMWRRAWQEDLLPNGPPIHRIPRAPTVAPIPQSWTLQEMRQVIAAARQRRGDIAGIPAGLWWESLLLVAYQTGERRTALLSTACKDISIEGRWIIFRHRKGGQPRCCTLDSDAVAACRQIYDPDRDLMWPFPARREALDDRFRWILKAAGVRPLPRMGLFHAIRRTTGTLVEANGGDGARAIGNTRRVFEKHYKDPRIAVCTQLRFLPAIDPSKKTDIPEPAKLIDDATWKHIRRQYEKVHLAAIAHKSAKAANLSLDAIERVLRPTWISDVNAQDRFDLFAVKRRAEGVSEGTIYRDLSALYATLSWAKDAGLTAAGPCFDHPKRVRPSATIERRAITRAELDRMIEAVPSVLPASLHATYEVWQRYLMGLWLSGLRLSESLELRWHHGKKMSLDLSAVRPLFRTPMAGGKWFVSPMAPEFRDFLQQVPRARRRGRIFRLDGCRGPLSAESVSNTVRECGGAADVEVCTVSETGRTVYASADDLRESFAQRWAAKVGPVELASMLRYRDVKRVARFYGQNT